MTKGGSFQAQPSAGYSPVHGLWKLRERHFQLMIAYNQASFPDLGNAGLTVLLEYHQWVMCKAIEGPYDPSCVQSLLKADFHMQTKWMLSWRQKEFPTFSDVVKHHRGHSAYLFTDLYRAVDVRKHDEKPRPSRSRSRARRGSGKKRSKSRKRSRSRSRRKEDRQPNTPSWPGLRQATKQGRKICHFFNKSSGCKKGAACPDAGV